MAWLQKAKELYKRFGAPAKFAANVVLGATIPGSPAVLEMLDVALATDEVCRRSARTLEQCAGQFDRLGKQNERVLAGQEEMLPILRDAENCRSAVRNRRAPGSQNTDLGCRVVLCLD